MHLVAESCFAGGHFLDIVSRFSDFVAAIPLALWLFKAYWGLPFETAQQSLLLRFLDVGGFWRTLFGRES